MSVGKSGGRTLTWALRRRRLGLVWPVIVMMLMGGASILAAMTANIEQVTRMWVGAEIAKDGSAHITEVIDYDFGSGDTPRHGIYRDIPGLVYDEKAAEIRVSLDSAPVMWELTVSDVGEDPRIRVGDPEETITGIHRYRVQYKLENVVKDGKLAWDAVGTAWKVDVGNIEIHVVTPYDLTLDPTGKSCVQGTTGSEQSCKVREVERGHLTADLNELAPGRGATLYASATGAALTDTATAPVPPAGKASPADTGVRPWVPGLLAFVVAVLARLLTIWVLRYVGRDRVARETSADGSAGDSEAEGSGSSSPYRRVDVEKLAVTLPSSPTPPEGLSPTEAGILLAEQIRPEHKTAWLLAAAADGHVAIEGDERVPTVRRLSHGSDDGPTDPVTRKVLRAMFAGRKQFTLGGYDPHFMTAWQLLDTELTEWQRTSGLWDEAADRRSRRGRGIGLAAILLGLAGTIVGAVLSAAPGTVWWLTVVAGAGAVGTGLALWVRSWELRSRTPRGSVLWLRTEAFRRFLAESDEPDDAEESERFTAWAVALGEIHHWTTPKETSTTTPPTQSNARHHRSTLSRLGPAMAVGLLTAATVSGTPPSSSGSGSGGSGGGSGGGVGGGEGGGGGGSW